MKNKNFVAKVPWGILAGACAIVIVFCTIAIVVLYKVDVILTIEGPEGITIFDTWYQSLLFAVDVICAAGLVVSVPFYAIKCWKERKQAKEKFDALVAEKLLGSEEERDETVS